jgi:alkylation response protein AidB-like acyl-CoA dehydrogenase
MGAEGLRDEYPFTRHLQAAQVAALTDGSTGMLLERIARDVRQHRAI